MQAPPSAPEPIPRGRRVSTLFCEEEDSSRVMSTKDTVDHRQARMSELMLRGATFSHDEKGVRRFSSPLTTQVTMLANP
jgi:hypothetical protein